MEIIFELVSFCFFRSGGAAVGRKFKKNVTNIKKIAIEIAKPSFILFLPNDDD
jgi:hypothetical protein